MTQTLLLLRIRGWGMVGLTSTRNRRDVGRALTDDGWVPGWWLSALVGLRFCPTRAVVAACLVVLGRERAPLVRSGSGAAQTVLVAGAVPHQFTSNLSFQTETPSPLLCVCV